MKPSPDRKVLAR